MDTVARRSRSGSAEACVQPQKHGGQLWSDAHRRMHQNISCTGTANLPERLAPPAHKNAPLPRDKVVSEKTQHRTPPNSVRGRPAIQCTCCRVGRVDINDGTNPPGAKAAVCAAPSSATAKARSIFGGWFPLRKRAPGGACKNAFPTAKSTGKFNGRATVAGADGQGGTGGVESAAAGQVESCGAKPLQHAGYGARPGTGAMKATRRVRAPALRALGARGAKVSRAHAVAGRRGSHVAACVHMSGACVQVLWARNAS